MMAPVINFNPTLNALQWNRPKVMNRHYELVAGFFQVGSLRVEGSLGNHAIGEFEGNNYYLKRTGLFKSGIEVINQDTGERVAKLDSIWGMKGTVTFGTRELQWQLGSMKRSFVVRDEHRRELGSFKLNGWNQKMTVNFNDEFVNLTEKGLISLLGMYLMSVIGYK